MAELVSVLSHSVGVAFGLLAVATVWDWLRHRDRNRVYLALALGLLGLVALVGQIVSFIHLGGELVQAVTVLAFSGSGLALLFFRDTFIPLSRRARFLATTGTLLVAVLAIFTLGSTGPKTQLSPIQVAATFLFVAAWSLSVGEPAVRFWLAARGRPSVQRARLRALSAGYAGIVLVLLIASVGGSQNLYIALVTQLLALCVVPLLYVSFAPPSWLRRIWREAEDEAIRQANLELLFFSSDVTSVAERALGWAIRMVGADAGAIISEGGDVLAAVGLGSDEALSLHARVGQDPRSEVIRVESSGTRHAIILPLPTDAGLGTLAVVSGPFTPLFGSDEVNSLELFSSSVAASIQRVSLIEALTAAQAMAMEAARIKADFLANMSHEIRTPMNGVIGMTDLLLSTRLTREQSGYAEAIKRSGESMVAVINDILDFSKIEAGKMELEVIDFDVRTVLDDVAEMIATAAHEKALEVATLIQPNVPERVAGDPGRLRQVLINIAGNAVKFTEEGEIVLRASLSTEDSESVVVRFEITDTGVGIAPEARARLFGAFAQADPSTTRRYGGTGLGLAISKQLVELMQGEIDVESEVGAGSRFWFTAKFQKADQTEQPVRTGVASLAGLRVLVVDDNQTNRMVLQQILTSWGMQPATASSGYTALSLMRGAAESGKPFALAALDFHMPEMNGVELARAIKRDRSIADIKLVLLTSSGHQSDAVTVRHSGVDAYLHKPVRASALYDCVAAVIGGVRVGAAAPMVTAGVLAEARSRARAHMLVVEDNRVNQKVAAAMLEKLGFRVDVAANGREAVEAVVRNRYAAVLMDCQMPEMDGYEATMEIRRRERETGSHTLIIAMTAGAMEGDREKCLAAGMDDYIAKPIVRASLDEALKRWMEKATPSDAGAESTAATELTDRPQPESQVALDQDTVATLKDLYSDRPETMQRLVDMFVDDTNSSLDSMRRAIERGDDSTVAVHAHSLKGTSVSLGATGIASLCAELEAAPAGDTEAQSHLVEQIDREFARAKVALARAFKNGTRVRVAGRKR
jgi:signal transduction histidine kinase/DNA-binding response OmpR family regulator